MTSSASISLDSAPGSQLEAVARRIERVLEKRAAQNRLLHYRPYPKQQAFHAAGAAHRERLFLAGNQLGKTLSGAFELAMHLTGRYPGWWEGRRWERPVVAWASCVSGESTRDNPQRLLLGRPGALGTGAVPAAAIESCAAARGAAELLDAVRVRHASGGSSTLRFKSYEQGRLKWQGETLDLVWFDEEPPVDVYGEGLARISATGGLVFITATPLLGMSEVVRRFLSEPSPDRAFVQMTIDDALHYGPAERARIVAGYREHERESRAMGVPALGSGRIYPVTEESLKIDPMPIPAFWPQIGGIDFGWDHPTAAVRLAWDRDNDRVYVTAVYRQRQRTPLVHAGALRAWGGGLLPWAWPQDGLQHSKDSGAPLAAQYRAQGLRLLPDPARYEDGRGNAVEAGLMDLLQRMEAHRLKVFATCDEWLEEFRLYHRKEGMIVKERDDLMDATRYAVMSLRFARVLQPRALTFQAATEWNPLT